MSHRMVILALSAAMFVIPLHTFAQERSGKGRTNGSVSISGGSNFQRSYTDDQVFKNTVGDASANLSYKRNRLVLDLNLSGQRNNLCTDKFGATLNVKEGKEAFKVDMSLARNLSTKIGAGLSSSFQLDSKNCFTAYYRQSYNSQQPDKSGVNVDLFEDGVTTYSIESGNRKINEINAGAGWLHNLDGTSHQADTKFTFYYKKDIKNTIWEKGAGQITGDDIEHLEFKEDDESYRKYRVTPDNMVDGINFSTVFRNRKFADNEKVDMTAALSFKMNHEQDVNEAANWIEQEWRDSLRYRESFDYRSFLVTPRVRIIWTFGQFVLDSDINVEYYTDRINDASHSGLFHQYAPSPILNIRFDWKPDTKNKLGLNLRRSITRPEYLQKCWFSRQGSYQNELQKGNIDLNPAITYRSSINYNLSLGRFSSIIEVGNTVIFDKIEKTFNIVNIEGTDFRVYTWINSGRSISTNAMLTLKWNAKRLNADIKGNYNYYIGLDGSGNETRNSEYSLAANASYSIPAIGMKFAASGRYQSKIIRSYSSTTEYIGVDVKAEKAFRKFSLFLEGRDLFDKGIDVTTYSEDKLLSRLERTEYNRRLFRLGATFKF